MALLAEATLGRLLHGWIMDGYRSMHALTTIQSERTTGEDGRRSVALYVQPNDARNRLIHTYRRLCIVHHVDRHPLLPKHGQVVARRASETIDVARMHVY
jgi:hypothetical protein